MAKIEINRQIPNDEENSNMKPKQGVLMKKCLVELNPARREFIKRGGEF